MKKTKPIPKIRKLDKARRREDVPAAVIETMMAGAGDDAAAAQLAYDRAYAWAHSAPGTAYGGTVPIKEMR